MNTVEKTMGRLMSVSLSFILSLVGLLSSGAFTVPAFLSSFLISLIVSTAITAILSPNKISSAISGKLSLKPGTLVYRVTDTLICDLLMSPLMTFLMVYLAYYQATAHGAVIPFGPMLLRSEIISFIVAYIALFFLSPLFLKFALKKAGIDPQRQ